jgi:hypothetical protein
MRHLALTACLLAVVLAAIRLLPAGLGANPPDLWGPDFGRFVNGEIKRWAEVVKGSGAKLD